MARERKCILCHIVYSSKKEMDAHMRSMLHHRELENLTGRDCDHECRVCRVTVVGLSTYAKHISSQLHKANVNALDKEDDAEEAEEVYFDKELIQLINKRKEQSRKKEECSSTKDQEAERYQKRRDERPVFQEMAPQNWHCDPSQMPWQWPNDCFNAMPVNLLHPSLKLGHNLHLPGPRGSAGWHLNGLPNHLAHHGNLGGSWHSNAGGSTSWHHSGSARNYHWHQEGNGNLASMMHPRTCGGNWQPNPYHGNQWNFSNAAESFPQGRNRPVRHCGSTQDKEKSWNKTNNTFSKEKFARKNTDAKSSAGAPHHTLSSKVSSEKPGNHSSKKVPEGSLSKTKTLEKSSNSSTAKPTCLGKGSNATKDKTHRWTPYPQQKGAETSHTPEPDLQSQVTASRNGEKKPDQTQNVPKAKDKVIPKTRDVSGKKAQQSEPKRPRMPSLKPPPRHVPDPKPSAIKGDQRNPLKGVKLQSPVGERQDKPNAPNLDLHGASQNTSDFNQENGQNELAETLGDVLRKAKEMLENSQCLQSPYFPSMKDAGVGLENSPTDHRDNSSAKDPVQPTAPTADHDGTKMDNVLQAKSTLESAVHSPSNSESSLEQVVPNTVPDAYQTESTGTENSTEHLDAEGSRITHESQDFREPGRTETVSESELQKGATSSSGAILPELSKLGLPASLQRDLSRHISSRSKTGAHLPEPNLNNARRIRNVSGHRKSETDKDSGIKPTLRHILNASRRNINWEQVMHHVMKKKQESGKGLPRFGIEMVAQVQSEQEGLDFDEEADLGIESFHWEGTSTCPLSTRKRSLSESSVTDKASVYIFTGHGSDTRIERSSPTTHSTPAPSGRNESSPVTRPSKQEEESVPIAPPEAPNATVLSDLPLAETSQNQMEDVKTHTASDGPHVSQGVSEDVDFGAAGGFTTSTPVDVATDSCASSTEQNDGQGAGKKRRATGDGSSCPEIPSLERNGKKRKIKRRKERSQVDQLLSISLREEELNNSLLGVENSLQQARTALQNAYIEVQRLMVAKQTLALEMSTMRTQRIQILQGLQQGSSEPASKISKQVTSQEPATPVVSPGSFFSFLLETPYVAPQASLSGSALLDPGRAFTPPTPQASSVADTFPDSSGSIKQEPGAPEMEEDNMVTSPDQADPPCESDGEACRNSSVYPIITATMSISELTRGFPQLDMPLSVDRPTSSDVPTTSMSCSSTNIEQAMCSSEIQSVFPKRPSRSQPQEANSCSPRPPEEPRAESTFNRTKNKAGKKKKKLRKKKTLRAAHVPENSDTEQDTCTSKPIRKIRGWKLSKETAVSTSTPLGQELGRISEKGGGNCDSDSSVQLVEIPSQQLEVVPIDSHSDDDDKPDSPFKMDVVGSMGRSTEANDEVTSTSEFGSNYTEEPNAPNNRRVSLTRAKNSSDVSSEPGEDDDPTEGRFEGHHASVNAIQIFEGLLYTCSADKTVRAYNLVNRQCVGVFEGHTSKVNCLLVTHTYGKSAMLFTGSSDCTVRCYSVKTHKFVEQIELGERVLCLHVRWRILYAGLANGTVVTFSLKNNKQIDVFECHGPRAVSCLATAQEGARRLLLVGSYDCTISVRDARNGLLLRTLEGHTKTVLCMKVVNDLVFSGSSDQTVHAHNIHTGELVRIYKGHNHAVTVVNILGKVMVTACLDKLVRVYELQSHDRLQVYGGHSDMIMCMVIHKSMIYTGCYDGSVQAVRLNLMQNYRCGWHGCSLIFGVVDHLKQHLLTDHTNPNFQTLKCRWKNCDAFFTARRGSKQDAVGHMERHADEDSRLNI